MGSCRRTSCCRRTSVRHPGTLRSQADSARPPRRAPRSRDGLHRRERARATVMYAGVRSGELHALREHRPRPEAHQNPQGLGSVRGRDRPSRVPHTAISHMLDAKITIDKVSKFMGHSSITVTIDRYGHLLPGGEAEAAALLKRLPRAKPPMSPTAVSRRRPTDRHPGGRSTSLEASPWRGGRAVECGGLENHSGG
jgi:hypothetical protein